MKEKKSSTYRRPGAIALCALIVTAMAIPVFAQAEADKKIDQGRLKIVGKGIEHLVLVDKDNKRHEVAAPGEVLSLPPGEYRPEQVRLKGDSVVIFTRVQAVTVSRSIRTARRN